MQHHLDAALLLVLEDLVAVRRVVEVHVVGDDGGRIDLALHLCEMASAMENFSTEDRLLTLLAVSAKLVLENLVLHLQLLRRHGLPVSEGVEALLGRLRKPE